MSDYAVIGIAAFATFALAFWSFRFGAAHGYREGYRQGMKDSDAIAAGRGKEVLADARRNIDPPRS